MDENSRLIWYTAIPVFRQKLAKAKQLVSVPFQNWREFTAYDHNEIIFYGEDESGSGLIATKARVTTLDGLPYVIFDNQFYRLYASNMVTMHKLKKTETIPPEVLYAIRLKGINESEDNHLNQPMKDVCAILTKYPIATSTGSLESRPTNSYPSPRHSLRAKFLVVVIWRTLKYL